ncbi:transcriptional regulator [Xylella fastidiosa]|uniref:transcriptional regulator n=1 Tax=Xylella fastidiosa TaxID=2371 RepID=UPI0015E1AB7E|nr:transcriptional regulator [Xylella fastidiosa]UIT53401.1 transcriptional regulator KorA [Xylella fastidiosa subsp. fastidiosa]WLE28540.1 transcriptional regulator KorA [Xylella fastidiosa subsp. multiplex]
MRAKRRMTAAEFEAVRPFLKISDDRIKAARAALFEGQTFQAILSPGWEQVTLIAPAHLIEKFRGECKSKTPRKPSES